MTPAELAALHARCFNDGPRPWSASEFADFATSRLDSIHSDNHALGVIRVIADEAELLTICVDPAQQGRGHGQRMLDALMQDARDRGALTMFLEVAADNTGARALYSGAGFQITGQRRGYYQRATGPVDAVVMSCDLTAAATSRQG